MMDERAFPNETLNELFRYHTPKEGQPERYVAVREAAGTFARILRDNVPSSADRTDAIRKLRECVMTAAERRRFGESGRP
jgi:hypothetical protein